MKRSAAVTLGLLPVMASWFLGCSPARPSYQQLCTDPNNRVVDDQRCDDERRAVHSSGYIPFYRYYYAPYRSVGYALGELANGGSSVRPTSGGIGIGRVVRGGFGSTAHVGGSGE